MIKMTATIKTLKTSCQSKVLLVKTAENFGKYLVQSSYKEEK